MPNKPISGYSGGSASAVDADNHLKGQDAADAESQRIDQWTKAHSRAGDATNRNSIRSSDSKRSGQGRK